MAKVKKDETLEEYRRFYPDTTVTEMTVLDSEHIGEKGILPAVLKLGKMTKSMPLYYEVRTTHKHTPINIRVHKSRKALAVFDKMCRKGCKVKYFDPGNPGLHTEGEIAEDGIYYMGGCAMVRIESAEAGLTSENDSFALWWRPVEE